MGGGGEIRPGPAVLDSEKPGLFRVNKYGLTNCLWVRPALEIRAPNLLCAKKKYNDCYKEVLIAAEA